MAGRWIFIVFVTGSEPPPPIYGTKATHLSVNSNKSLKQQFIYRKSTPEWQMAMNWNWYTPKIWAKPPQGSSMRPGRQHQKGQKQHKDEYTHTHGERQRERERGAGASQLEASAVPQNAIGSRCSRIVWPLQDAPQAAYILSSGSSSIIGGI